MYPTSRFDDGTDAAGRFTLRFVPGLRYRFTFDPAAGTPHVLEHLVTGEALRFVVPLQTGNRPGHNPAQVSSILWPNHPGRRHDGARAMSRPTPR